MRSLVAWQFGLFLRNTRCTEIYPTLSHHSEAGKVGLAPRQYVVTGNLGIRWSKLPVLQRAERTTYGATFNAILISRTAWHCMVKLLRDLWSFLDIQNLAEKIVDTIKWKWGTAFQHFTKSSSGQVERLSLSQLVIPKVHR